MGGVPAQVEMRDESGEIRCESLGHNSAVSLNLMKVPLCRAFIRPFLKATV